MILKRKRVRSLVGFAGADACKTHSKTEHSLCCLCSVLSEVLPYHSQLLPSFSCFVSRYLLSLHTLFWVLSLKKAIIFLLASSDYQCFLCGIMSVYFYMPNFFLNYFSRSCPGHIFNIYHFTNQIYPFIF